MRFGCALQGDFYDWIIARFIDNLNFAVSCHTMTMIPSSILLCMHEYLHDWMQHMTSNLVDQVVSGCQSPVAGWSGLVAALSHPACKTRAFACQVDGQASAVSQTYFVSLSGLGVSNQCGGQELFMLARSCSKHSSKTHYRR